MKKTIRNVAFIGMLCIAAAGCTKDPIDILGVTVNTETVYYSTGGNMGSITLGDDSSWDAFLDRMLALAREGYEITIFSSSSLNGVSSKEVVTYTTTSEDDAKRWAKEMHENGYSVSIDYDKSTGNYICTAVK